MNLTKLIELFESADRIGHTYDDPEGARYICISDTAAKEATEFLKAFQKQSVKTTSYEPKILFFDTETSGFINKKLQYNDPDQAWCIQIGAILSTKDKIYQEMNVLIKSDGRTIHPKAQEVHGISVEQADKEGLPELEAINKFGSLMRKSEAIVCHNYDFDWAYVYQMMQRNLDQMTDEARSAFYLDLPSYCTMKSQEVKQFCDLKNKAGRIKWPKLIELHEKLFGFGFDNAHDAFADIKATRDCYFELVNKGIIGVQKMNTQVE